jgi:tRNA nucleotidyltransferase/poly(A) polymerase
MRMLEEISNGLARWFPGAYLAGGCVRDALLDRDPADIDIVVPEVPDIHARAAAAALGGRVVVLGTPPDAVYRVVLPDRMLDVTERVGGSFHADLLRRDFTVNAMGWDIGARRLVDPAGGRADLAKRRIRPVTPEVFARDPVRLVRALRFGAELEFALAPETLEGLRRHAFRIARPAGERIRVELRKLVATGRSAPFLRVMVETGILAGLLPDMDALPDPGSCERLEAGFRNPSALPPEAARAIRSLAPEDRSALIHVALLRASGGGAAGARARLDALAARLRWSRRETERTKGLLACADRLAAFGTLPLETPEQWTRTREAGRFFRDCGIRLPAVLLLRRAEADPADVRLPARMERLLRRHRVVVLPRLGEPPLLAGRDLVETLGLPPSPRFRELLEAAEIERLRGAIHTREAALEAVRKRLEKPAPPDAAE